IDDTLLTSGDPYKGLLASAKVMSATPINNTLAISELIDPIQRTNLNDEVSSHFIDSSDSVMDLVDSMAKLPTEPPSLYLDLEGVFLSRHGTISILQVFIPPKNCVYLLDVHSLHEKAFFTAGTDGQTLKAILESNVIPKVFFDVRNDSDALYAHFGIRLAGIQDIQLMELATRSFSRRCVNGLSRCIERDAVMTPSEKGIWASVKEKGLKLFAPEHGGCYEVFNARPLAEDIRAYCIQDVQFMPRLLAGYSSKITQPWALKVDEATKERVALSQSETFNGKGSHMALGPWPVSNSVRRGRGRYLH
ncbi:MAG: hypothetical protein M1812_008294, partial [Candelaria pacifica]